MVVVETLTRLLLILQHLTDFLFWLTEIPFMKLRCENNLKFIYIYNAFTRLFNVNIQRTASSTSEVKDVVFCCDRDKGTAKRQSNQTQTWFSENE